MAVVSMPWSDQVVVLECREEWRLFQDEWEAIVEGHEERMDEWEALVADFFSLRKLEEKETPQETLDEWERKEYEWEAILEEKEEIMEEWEFAVANFFSLI